jgi:hypothetical protein
VPLGKELLQRLRVTLFLRGRAEVKTGVLESFLAGPFTDRAAVGRLRLPMNFLRLLSIGLEIQIHGSERGGRRERDSQNSSRIVEPCLFWTVWSRSKTRLVHKKDAYVSLPSRRFCASLLPSIKGFA